MEGYRQYYHDDTEDEVFGAPIADGQRHNFSYLQLDEEAMENHLDTVFFATAHETTAVTDVINAADVRALSLCHNRMSAVPRQMASFVNLHSLDLSSNRLAVLDDSLVCLVGLRTLVAKNNLLTDDSLPKEFGNLRDCLTVLNLSGNRFTAVCPQLFELVNLRYLHLGGNRIGHLPSRIGQLQKLEVLYLGGNRLKEIPAELGSLHQLEALIICENQLASIPSSISQLKRLRSLGLHKNCLTTLPPDIVTLRGLDELSLRDNPLVVRFVKDLIYDPPTLLELSARCIKTRNLGVKLEELPYSLRHYLDSAQRCVNPRCKGVYFDVCVQHIKFVDFCGKYRIPLLQYLCSPKCRTSPAVYSSESDQSDDDASVPASKLKKVLLG